MIDDDFKVFLIEINTNPDISVCCPMLTKIIPQMLENTFKIALDPLFPPPSSNHSRKCSFNLNPIENNKYSLVYDSNQDYADIHPYLIKIDPKILGEIDESASDSDEI